MYNRENVFVHHHTSWIQVMEVNVKAHAIDIHVELTPNVHQVIHRNVCAKWVIVAIHSEDARAKMNALILHAPTVHNVSMRKEATNVFVQKVKLVTLTEEAAY